jgi:TRAP-type transport system small permease protein
MLQQVGRNLRKGIFSASSWLNIVSIAVLVIMTLLVTADVIVRRLFSSPIPGTVEILTLGLGVVVFASLAYCEVKQEHVILDLITVKFKKLPKTINSIFIRLISTGLLGMISWQLFLYAGDTKKSNQVGATIDMPTYPFVFVAAIGASLFTLVFLVRLVSSIHEVTKR